VDRANEQSSNDYLSLTDSASLRSTFLNKLEESPRILGSTGSRLLSGSTPDHTALETRFREFFDAPSALLFNSGWDANVSFFATVPQPGDWVIYDELVHASVHSGLRASRVDKKRRIPFRHNDPEGLTEVLKQIDDEGTVFLTVESLYSMDGDFAPLPALLDVLDEHVTRDRQCVVVDEAHSTGVYGEHGRGVTHALGEQGRVGVRLMTFGKAVGSSGGTSLSLTSLMIAVLLCPPTIRSFLINFARPFIFSTAISHTSLIALHSAFDLLQSQEGNQVSQI
jgi:8-amino-7-oxononanoate synthase